jgi:hypothetical protein
MKQLCFIVASNLSSFPLKVAPILDKSLELTAFFAAAKSAKSFVVFDLPSVSAPKISIGADLGFEMMP